MGKSRGVGRDESESRSRPGGTRACKRGGGMRHDASSHAVPHRETHVPSTPRLSPTFHSSCPQERRKEHARDRFARHPHSSRYHRRRSPAHVPRPKEAAGSRRSLPPASCSCRSCMPSEIVTAYTQAGDTSAGQLREFRRDPAPPVCHTRQGRGGGGAPTEERSARPRVPMHATRSPLSSLIDHLFLTTISETPVRVRVTLRVCMYVCTLRVVTCIHRDGVGKYRRATK